jgi:oxygen-dependent protoporphyrinogen oxidase
MASVGIIGAGISGLTAAFRLRQAGLEPVVFEKEARPGGMIHSERFDAPTTAGSYLVEFGPNSLRASTSLLDDLVADLGLEDRRVEAHDDAQRRYVVFSGRPVALPSSLRQLVSTELFSPQAKLRLLAEPVVGRTDEEESVAAFARRRLGQEVLDYGLNPFTAGVFAGDPEQLSVEHAFPRIHALEQEHGSLIGGSVKRAAGRFLRRLAGRDPDDAEPRGPFSLKGGLNTFPHALADRLSDSLQYQTEVQSLHRTDDAQWRVRYTQGGEDDSKDDGAQTFDALVWTAPLPTLLALTPRLDADVAPLEDVSYPPVSVVAMGFPREAVEHPLDGFGMLVPEAEDGCRTLGTLFSSTVFPHRAPEGRVLLTTFVGGTRDPALAGAPDSEVYEAVSHDLRHLLGAHDPPVFQQRMHWPYAIPQYHVGYGRVKDAIDEIEASCPGLVMAGNYRAGVSVGDAAESGQAAARQLAEQFG